jgi:flotillin
LRCNIEACGGAQQAFQLLMLEHLDKMVEASARAISNIKFDKVVVWENGGGNGATGNTAGFLHSLARTMPPMMQVLKDIGGVELPETLARFSPEPQAAANGGAAAVVAASAAPLPGQSGSDGGRPAADH